MNKINIKNPRRIVFTVQTTEGPMKIKAYDLGRGLFVHRHIASVYNGQYTLGRPKEWKVSTASGFGIAGVYGKLSEVLEGCLILAKLDWNRFKATTLKLSAGELLELPKGLRARYRNLRNEFETKFS